MKLKNFRLHNKEFFYFILKWPYVPFFEMESTSPKHIHRFPADHSPNAFIPPAERRRNFLNLLKISKLKELFIKEKKLTSPLGSSTQTGAQTTAIPPTEVCRALVRVEDYEPKTNQNFSASIGSEPLNGGKK